MRSRLVISERHQSQGAELGVEQDRSYLLIPSRAVASQSIGVTLTPNASEEIVRDAFDLQLHCV